MDWNLKESPPLKFPYLAEAEVKRPEITLAEGIEKTKQIVDKTIRQVVAKDIGGDDQRIHYIYTDYSLITWNQATIFLPVWLWAYSYKNQSYQVLVNGSTGKVIGNFPTDWSRLIWPIIKLVGKAVVGLTKGNPTN